MKKFKSKGWDELFVHEVNRWKKPNKYTNILTKELKRNFRNNIRVLDIGYGAGRHINFLIKNGFDTYGFDIAKNAEKYTNVKSTKLTTFDMNKFPWSYKDNFLNGALAINVIHHTNYTKFKKIIKEISRILVPNGLFLATIVSKENHKFGKGKKLDNNSYITDEGAEKGIPHCFLDERDIKNIFNKKFKILKLKIISGEIPKQDIKFRKKGALDHWLIFAQKKSSY